MSLSDPFLFASVTCTGMVATEAWEGMAAGAGVAVIAVGVVSTVLIDEGKHVRFLLRYGGFL